MCTKCFRLELGPLEATYQFGPPFGAAFQPPSRPDRVPQGGCSKNAPAGATQKVLIWEGRQNMPGRDGFHSPFGPAQIGPAQAPKGPPNGSENGHLGGSKFWALGRKHYDLVNRNLMNRGGSKSFQGHKMRFLCPIPPPNLVPFWWFCSAPIPAPYPPGWIAKGGSKMCCCSDLSEINIFDGLLTHLQKPCRPYIRQTG